MEISVLDPNVWEVEWESGRVTRVCERSDCVYNTDTHRCEAWPSDWTVLPGFLSAVRRRSKLAMSSRRGLGI